MTWQTLQSLELTESESRFGPNHANMVLANKDGETYDLEAKHTPDGVTGLETSEYEAAQDALESGDDVWVNVHFSDAAGGTHVKDISVGRPDDLN